MADYEKLGAFYLGRELDDDGGVSDLDLLYDSRDLTTHALCVGMTGSGKTGLCISLLEEAAIDGVPALIIDPKGDLANLCLTFPELRPQDFAPWIDEQAAARKDMTVEQYAADRAELWRTGLAKWGQDGSRIAKLRAAADVHIYTPGSHAGTPISVLKSFAAPSPETRNDAESYREHLAGTAASVLALAGITAEPGQSREHTLISTILAHHWDQGKNLRFEDLIRAVIQPPIAQIGVLDLETFYPKADRTTFATRLNNLLASPGFATWREGVALDIQKLLWTPEGKPRLAVLSIAHLSDEQRMFFVTLVLNEMTAWMRRQSGTSSLRALLYMDEIFGYFPPTANPPSKLPMLRLLKQARAFGVGIVLATQNPVDLDYKGLSNTGTWFLGRLQTERDVDRVIDGLKSIDAGVDSGAIKAQLAGLDSRVFLMRNVHEDGPVRFHTRWAMSYLSGPLTRTQIEKLSDGPDTDTPPQTSVANTAPPTTTPPQATSAAATPPTTADATATEPPVIDDDIPQGYVGESSPDDDPVALIPHIVGSAELHYSLASADLDVWMKRSCAVKAQDVSGRQIWTEGALLRDQPPVDDVPQGAVQYAELDPDATKAKSYTGWEKTLKTHLYRACGLEIYSCRKPKLYSEAGEARAAFMSRLQLAARELRDEKVDKLRDRYASKLEKLEDRIDRAEDKVEREQQQYSDQKYRTGISAGSAVLGALFGRKVASRGNVGRAATTLRGVSRLQKEKQDIARAQSKVDDLRVKVGELAAELEQEIAETAELEQIAADDIKVKIVRPKKTDIAVSRVGLVWIPAHSDWIRDHEVEKDG